MKELVSKIEQNGWSSHPGGLTFSCQEVILELNKDEVREGAFQIYAPADMAAEGYVLCTDERMECLTASFRGSREEIVYRFHAEGMKEQETRQGYFLILSDAGEYKLPYRVVVVPRSLASASGEIDTLFAFTALAKNRWDEALRIFYAPEFERLLKGGEASYKDLYRGLKAGAHSGRNMDEFLVTCGKKEPLSYELSSKEAVLSLRKDQLSEDTAANSVKLTKNGWGDVDITVDAVGSFLLPEKRHITGDDFLNNQCQVLYYVDFRSLRKGKNCGKLIFSWSGHKMEYPVTVIVGNDQGKDRLKMRLEMRGQVVELVQLYLNYKMKKINASFWRSQTAEVVNKMRRANENSIEPVLFQVHLLIAENRYEDAGQLLHMLHIEPEDYGPDIFGYYLYLCSLYKRDQGYTDAVREKVEQLHRMYPDSWRIAWLLLYLSPMLNKSGSQRWMFLEEQCRHNANSPVLYYEALYLANMSPTLLMKLGDYELHFLAFGMRNDMIREDLAEHVAYLSEKEKYFNSSLFRLLEHCYKVKPSPTVLRALCSYLIKGSRTDEKACGYYRLGLESEARVTRLYEYYMMSLDLKADNEIPKMVLMYFVYQSNLDQEHTAYLYRYVYLHREEYPDLYEMYREQMERFLLQQLYKGKISADLACLYQEVLGERLLTRDNAKACAPLLFLKYLECSEPDVRFVLVRDDRLADEQRVPVENGRALVRVCGEDSLILLEDEAGNRYRSQRKYMITDLMDPLVWGEKFRTLVDDDLYLDLFLCKSRKGMIHIEHDLVPRFVRLSENPAVEKTYASAIRMELLKYYDRESDTVLLDRGLDELAREDVADQDLYDAVSYLAHRGFSEKAYEWLAGLDIPRLDAGSIFRLTGALIEGGHHDGEQRLLSLARCAFEKGKYDNRILTYLVDHLEADCRQLEDVLKASENREINTYPIKERLLSQLLYSGGDCRGKSGILKGYLADGGRSSIEAAFLHKFSNMHLYENVEPDSYVLTDMARMASRGDAISDLCRISYLKYYADHPGERSPQTDETVQIFGGDMVRRGIQLPLFKEYADLIEGAETQADKTIVVYQSSGDGTPVMHYRILIPGEDEETALVRSLDMKPVYDGIYSAGFVLFSGEKLQYFITEGGNNEKLAGGELYPSEEAVYLKESRFGMLNDVAYNMQKGERNAAQEILEQYLMCDWMTDSLFEKI